MEWVCTQFILHERPIHSEFGLGGYKCESKHRKPEPGMILDAARGFGIDLTASILLGDKESNIPAERAAGVGGFLYASDERSKHIPTQADVVFTELRELLLLL